MDFKNRFLNGVIQEEVYVSQPLGFKNVSFSHAMCKLNKALYGLKQAPRALIDLASSCFHKVSLRAQLTPLFVLRKQHQMMVLLLYVDDKIITGHTSSLFDEFLLQLKSEFAVTDLGQVHYFLGVQVQTLSSGLSLSQTRCAFIKQA